MQIETIHSPTEKEVFEFRVRYNYGDLNVCMSNYTHLEKESVRKRNWGIKARYTDSAFQVTHSTNVTKEFAYSRLPKYWKDIITQKIISQIKFL